MEYLMFFKSNWMTILGALAIMTVASYHMMRWLDKPKAQQIADLKEWMKFAVVEAEKLLGYKTGELKLRWVYDKALVAFPWVAKFISFEIFKVYVDETLDWMRKELSENDSVAAYVNN